MPIIVLLVACTIALCTAAVGGYIAKKYYSQWSGVRLNPIDTAKYAAENAALPRRAASRRIVFIGDSRMERWNPKPELPAAEMIWRGLNSETTAQMRYRFRADALDLEPNVVVIQSGINDIVAGIAVGRPQEAVDTALANLLTMASAAVNSGSEVYVLTVVRPARPSLLRRPVWSETIYARVADMNAKLRKWSIDKVHVIDADTLLSSDSRVLPAKYSEDTLHFSAAAYGVMNQQLVQQLRGSYAVQ